MFILPALCEESWINMVFVSEVNKTTMQWQNRGDGEATEMWFGSLWTSGHDWEESAGVKNTDLFYSVRTVSSFDNQIRRK